MLIQQKQEKNSKRPKFFWIKQWLTNMHGKIAWINIFLELMSTDKFRHYLRMNATPYIDFYTLITFTSYITYTYNYTVCIDYFIVILIFTIHYGTCFSFLQVTSSLLHNYNNRINDAWDSIFWKSISLNEVFSFWKLKIYFTEIFHESLK